MIRIRLKELMNETGTNISEISEKTGINRASLKQIADNNSKMVKLDTLDKLKIFFDVEDVYELFADDDSSVIQVYPHKIVDSHFNMDMRIDIQLSRDAEPVHQDLSIRVGLDTVGSDKLLFVGKIVHTDKNFNFTVAKKLFSELHPMIIDNFFAQLSDLFMPPISYQDGNYIYDYENGKQVTDNNWLVSDETQRIILDNDKSLVFFAIPELGLSMSYQCLRNTMSNGLTQVSFLTFPDMGHVFPNFELHKSQISFKIHPLD